jgi:hypothetical protein
VASDEVFGDLLEARRIALPVNVALQVAEYLALALGERHLSSLGGGCDRIEPE